MPGRTHRVTFGGEELVEACERRFGSYCRFCTAEEPVACVPPVRWEVLREVRPGKWVQVLGPTTRVRAEQWWVLYYRDGGPAMRVQEVPVALLEV